MTKAIIFDLYGVLALNGWQAFKTEYFSDRVAVWDQVFELGRKVDSGLADYGELIRFTAEQTGVGEDKVRYQLEHTVANDALLEYIQTELKPYFKLAILSNASSNKIIDQILTAEQEKLFDTIVLSHHVGLTKPDRGMYEAVADKLGIEMAECIFVDDQERHVTGAGQVGMQALLYKNVANLRKDLIKLL